MTPTMHGIHAAKVIKALDVTKLDPCDKLAVLKTAAHMLENEITCAAMKLSLKKIVLGE